MPRVNTPPGRRDPIVHRMTAIWFPRFAIECWRRRADRRGKAPPGDLPVALARDGPHGPAVHAANAAAERAGAGEGGRVADMRALCPGLLVEQADIGADAKALERLMLWARRWCPWTAVDGTEGIVMDTTGSDHLWGGEAAMLRDIEERLAGLGFSCRLATAPTHGAAWALSRLGATREICASEDLAARMAPLPVRALRLNPETAMVLERLGLKTVGALSAVPRLPLARRFARGDPSGNPLIRLDQMMGRTPEPVNAPGDPPGFAAEARLAEPVQDPLPYLPQLAGQLCKHLGEAGLGARHIVLTIYRTDGETARVAAAAAHPTRDAEHIRRLFDGKLERIDPGFGFDLITLGAPAVEPLSPIQTRLGGEAEEAVELARLTDRLTARFGAAAVKRAGLRESHIPERRERWAAAMEPPSPASAFLAAPRPVRLLDPAEEVRVIYTVPEGPPARFIWRRATYRVTGFAGPERIGPEWWRARPGSRMRDYFRIEDQRGMRLWLYREGLLGDGRGAAPRWFVHGVFE